MPVTSLPTLRKIDMETTDLAELRAIVKYPETIDFKQESLNMTAFTEMDGNRKDVAAKLQLGAADQVDKAMRDNLTESGYRVDVLQMTSIS